MHRRKAIMVAAFCLAAASAQGNEFSAATGNDAYLQLINPDGTVTTVKKRKDGNTVKTIRDGTRVKVIVTETIPNMLLRILGIDK